MIDDRKLTLDFHTAPEIDILVERSINHSRALHALRLFDVLKKKGDGGNGTALSVTI